VGTSSAHAKEVWEKHYLRYLHFVSTLVEAKDYDNTPQFKAFAGVKKFLERIDFDHARKTWPSVEMPQVSTASRSWKQSATHTMGIH
jgi:hypothetical protein